MSRLLIAAALAFLLCAAGAGAQRRPTPPVPTEKRASAVALAADPAVARLLKHAQALEKKLKAHPTDKALRQRTADATYAAGHAMMVSPKLGSRVKYRGALRLFRRTLQLDPRHRKALSDKNLIVGIYRQMGRPVPG